MNIATSLLNVLKAIAAFLVIAIGFLFRADDDGDDERSISDGSDLFGEHNFRSGNLDAGSDPDGWYEEDL